MKPFYFSGGPVGCLLVHGFCGGSSEMRGLGEYLAAQGYTVCGSLLPGHGTSPEDLASTSWYDWLRSAELDLGHLLDMCSKVFAVGLSIGGAISLILASEYPVSGVVAMSTPAPLQPYQVRILLALRRMLKWMPRIRRSPHVADPQALSRFSTYDRTPVRSVMEVVRLIGRLRYVLPRVQAPALIIHSTADHSISPTNAQFIHDHLGSADKTMRLLHRSGHNITVDIEREAVWRSVGEFVARIAGENRPISS